MSDSIDKCYSVDCGSGVNQLASIGVDHKWLDSIGIEGPQEALYGVYSLGKVISHSCGNIVWEEQQSGLDLIVGYNFW